ncbi:hypothetical protein EK904_003237 [Melospiza melodia maxima]|nr:hypothetical protein EK904_003237 [Melospiza melodia maxima]
MAVDWIGFAYASLLVFGGVVAYTRKGSKISLAAGLTFGSVAAYGAFCVTCDPKNVKISLCKEGSLIAKGSRGIVVMKKMLIAIFCSKTSFIFSFDHYNGNEVQEVQEINARTSSMPEPIYDFEAYAAVGEFRTEYDCHDHQTDMLSVLERQV